MSKGNHDEANNLQLSIHGVLIGYLAGFKDGRIILDIGGSIKKDPTRSKSCNSDFAFTHPKGVNVTLRPQNWQKLSFLQEIIVAQ